jgi:hypothetical protein
MEFRFSQAHNVSTERPKANDTQLRLFHVLTKLRLAPHDDLTGSWEVCSPQSVSQFTAVGYFFGKDLRSALKRPIGLVESCCGGTSAQAWTSLSALQANPALHNHVDEFNHFAANFPGGDTEFVDRQEAYQKWQQQVHDDQVIRPPSKLGISPLPKPRHQAARFPPDPRPRGRHQRYLTFPAIYRRFGSTARSRRLSLTRSRALSGPKAKGIRGAQMPHLNTGLFYPH